MEGTMSCMIRCVQCGRHFIANPRVKNQRYCGSKECQRARKTLWQREKMRTDTEYQANQRESHRSWRERNPGYWKQYRSGHPEYAMRNRLLQRHRDKRTPHRNLAKMDALGGPFSSVKAGSYYLIAQGENLAKMDALTHKVYLIPTS